MKRAAFAGSLVAAFALGGAGMWAWQHSRHDNSPGAEDVMVVSTPKADPLDILSGAPVVDPIQQMAQMRRQMEAFFDRDDFFRNGGFAGRFGSWFSGAQGSFGTRVEEGEDRDSVFYKLQVGDGDVSDVNVTVQNGYVSINARMNEQSRNAYASSSIAQTFPVPPGVNPDSAKVDREGDSIVVRFEKVS